MQVIGVCRFSYPAIGGFQVCHETNEDREAFLYAPARMEERFRFFETLTLPSIRAQTDGDFKLIIVIGESLPLPYYDRLSALVAGIPQIELRAYPPRKHRRIMQVAINSVRQFDAAPCLQFRLDDDDAIAVDFVSKLRDVARETASLLRHNGCLAIDFNQGYYAMPDAAGLHVLPLNKPFMTAALGVALAADQDRSVMNFPHHKLARLMPTVTMTGEDMYLRGLHQTNDSRQKPVPKLDPPALLDAKGEAHFEARFGVSSDKIRQVFG